MAISLDFKKTVSEGDVRLVQIILKDSLIIDPTFREFNEMFEYSKNRMPGLLAEFDNGKLDYSEINWSKDYINELKVELMDNFSNKRIEHLKKICAYIYRDRIQNINSSHKKTAQSSEQSIKPISTGAIIVGVAVSVIGLIAAKPLIIATGSVIAIIGGAGFVAGGNGDKK